MDLQVYHLHHTPKMNAFWVIKIHQVVSNPQKPIQVIQVREQDSEAQAAGSEDKVGKYIAA